MSAWSIVEVAIGVVFIYVLLSIFCTLINEIISRWFSLRSNNLRKNLQILLSDKAMNGIAKDVWEHPLIKGNAQTNIGPSYIASETFAKVLIDIINEHSKGDAKTAKTGRAKSNPRRTGSSQSNGRPAARKTIRGSPIRMASET